MFCARQQIAFHGHRNEKIHFDEAPACNEGNFVAIIRMLAECTSSLKKHLISGSRNARYIRKTIRNEIIAVYADLTLLALGGGVFHINFVCLLITF